MADRDLQEYRGHRLLQWGFVLFLLGLLIGFAAIWGAGTAMPIAAVGHEGSAFQESLIMGLLISLSLAMVGAIALVLWGLRQRRRSANLSP